MEITRTAKNTMPEQVQENMGNIDALNNELENRPVGLIDKGDWTRGRHYYPQQVVQYNGASYLCTRSIISYATPDTDPAHFKLFAAGQQGEQGETGNGIASITKISTVGLVDTYRITFTDGTTYDYTVTNGQNGTNGTNGQDGNGIASITKISTVGLVDTYRITFTDNTTFDYTVTNGQTYTFDNTPTENSSNPVTSGGIYDALANKEDLVTYTSNSNGKCWRFNSGLQICTGYKNNASNNVTVTYPLAFNSVPTCAVTQTENTGTWNDNFKVNSHTTTKFNLNMGGTASFNWIAVGTWK